jgi:hypothetical protein
MYFVFVGPFDSVKRGMECFSEPLTPLEMEEILNGREQSESTGLFELCEFH